jgi:multidrug efflux pump
VKAAIGEFMETFLEAVFIVLVMSFLALGLRAGFVVAVTIPLVLAATFMLMRQFGIDLHRISTGALIIALGLLVDDAMIVIEMMVRKLEEGFDRLRAATFAYTATAFPMLTGTLITVAGFLPIATAKSGTGEYTFAMFAVISMALLVSWLAAVFVTPLVGFHILKAHPGTGHDVFDTPFYKRLRRVIEWCLGHRKSVIVATLAAFVLGVVGMGLTEKQFFPSSNRTEIMVELWLPEGSSIHATEKVADTLGSMLAKNKDITTYVSYVGNSSPRFFLSLNQQLFRPNYAQVVVLTKDMPSRERVMEYLHGVMAERFNNVRVRVLRVPLGPPVDYPIEFRLLGDDVPTLKGLAEQVRKVMQQDDRLRNVHASWGDMAPALRVDVDQDRARVAGVSSADIARTLNGVIEGMPVGQFREGDQLIDIVLRAPRNEAMVLDQMASVNVVTDSGHSVPLNQVAQVTMAMEEPIYWRRSRDLMMSVRADNIDGVQAPDVSAQLDAKFAAIRKNLPPGYRFEVGGSLGESASAQASINAGVPLMLAVILSLLMIQLKSISRTIMVLITAPLGIIGVALALLVFHQPFGFVAMLGTIALGGMIMRNTVILVDQIRQDLAAGLPPWDAIRESTLRRFRPIVLTAAAAILAMIPLTSSVLWGPMAYAIMGGLLVATALTILFVPVLYAAWFRVKKAVA